MIIALRIVAFALYAIALFGDVRWTRRARQMKLREGSWLYGEANGGVRRWLVVVVESAVITGAAFAAAFDDQRLVVVAMCLLIALAGVHGYCWRHNRAIVNRVLKRRS